MTTTATVIREAPGRPRWEGRLGFSNLSPLFMDWIAAPFALAKAIAVAAMTVAGMLLALGITVAVGLTSRRSSLKERAGQPPCGALVLLFPVFRLLLGAPG
jgi:hypothetical protein